MTHQRSHVTCNDNAECHGTQTQISAAAYVSGNARHMAACGAAAAAAAAVDDDDVHDLGLTHARCLQMSAERDK
jgi:hypothetical protein